MKHKAKIIWILMITPFFILGQSLSLKIITSDDGLPSNSVFDIFQDSKGFLWLCTEDGAARFDGTYFKVLKQTDGLLHSFVRKIFEDSKGNFWFSTNEGLSKLSGKRFINYSNSDGNPFDRINSIDEDSEGNIWIGTSVGPVLFDSSGVRLLGKKDGFPADSVNSHCFVDRNNFVWISLSGYGIIKYKKNIVLSVTEKDGLVNNSVSAIIEDRNGNLIFGSGRSIHKFDGKKLTSTEIVPESNNDFTINFILEDTKRDFWVGTEESGLFKISENKITHYTKANGLTADIMECGLEDRRGDLWFGTRTGGLIRFPAERFLIYSTANGLADNVVYGIHKGSDDIWFSHEVDGITRIKNDKKFYYNSQNKLISDAVPVVRGDKSENIWIGYYGEGLTKYNKIGDNFSHYTINDNLSSNIILSIIVDSQNNIWFGTSNGITEYNSLTSTFVNYPEVTELFQDYWLNNIYEDFQGFLWVATDGNGLYKFNGHKFIEKFTTEKGLPSNFIFSTTQDRAGNYWISTEGGLSKFNGESFTNYYESDGLPSNQIYFAVDYKEFLYLGTVAGVTRFDYNKFEESGKDAFKTFTAKEGLAATECTAGGIFVDGENNMYFATQKGVTVYNPENKPINQSSPVYISNIRIISDEAVRDTTPSEQLDLEFKDNSLTFEFICTDFVAPEKVEYRYKLLGADNNWTTTNDHSVTYRELSAKDYRFIVEAKNSDGLWSEKSAEINLKVFPPFYLTWWFFSLVGVLVILATTRFYKYKTDQVKLKNLELEEEVKRRTREVEIEKDKTDQLLKNIIPQNLIDELKDKGEVAPREYKNVSILFTDFKGFTYTASTLPADRLVRELNDIFKAFDDIIEKYQLEKLKTIGDAYMAAGGLPEENEMHAVLIVFAALEMQKAVERRNLVSAIKWEMRVGVHSGQVIAGVVGSKKFTYDIWGDTVNIASRMESSGEPGEINISAYTYMLVRDYFECEYRGKVDAKGKGLLDMYFVRKVKKNLDGLINSRIRLVG